MKSHTYPAHKRIRAETTDRNKMETDPDNLKKAYRSWFHTELSIKIRQVSIIFSVLPIG